MRKPILSETQLRAIAAVYDGKTETIERLVKRFGVKRHNILAAAKRGGYKTARKRNRWTADKDRFLTENWGRKGIDEIARRVGATVIACRLRAKRLKVSSRNIDDPTVHDLEHLTKLDHRQWRFYRDMGWLVAWEQPRDEATPIVRVTIEELHRLLRRKPEILDYRTASARARAALQLDSLPDPPKSKRVTCHSEAWTDTMKLTPVGPRHTGAAMALEARNHSFSLKSCSEEGGTSFSVPLFASDISCPRCGCKVSRYSEGNGEYSEVERTGTEDVLAALAGKLGLKWMGGGLVDATDAPVRDERLLAAVFDGNRPGGRAFSVFERLLSAGLNLQRLTPVPDELWMPDLTGMKLKEDQQHAFNEFCATGRIGVHIPPGRGKSALARYILSRLPGEHVVFVHTKLILDDWVAAFKALPVRVGVRTILRPNLHTEVTLFERSGQVRCKVDIFNYRTGCAFDKKHYQVRVFDESHFLPGRHAVRLLYKVQAKFQLSLTATPLREDKRSGMLEVISARSIGGDWGPYRDNKEIPDVPVQVIVVDDMEAKIAAAERELDPTERTLIFSDSLAVGHKVAANLGVPFVHYGTKDKLATVRANRVVVLSRTGDCGISVSDVEHVIEVTFQQGGRAQSLQRHGRLLHSHCAKRHTVLMTRDEVSRHFKRLTILEKKGCRISLKLVTGARGRPPVITPIKASEQRPSLWCDILPLAA